MSYKVVKYRQLDLGAVESSEIAWFDNSNLADNYSLDLNAQEPPGGSVWYEAHPSAYSQVPNRPPTPPPFGPTLTKLKDAQARLEKRAELYYQYVNPAWVMLGISLVLAVIFITSYQSLVANRKLYV